MSFGPNRRAGNGTLASILSGLQGNQFKEGESLEKGGGCALAYNLYKPLHTKG